MNLLEKLDHLPRLTFLQAIRIQEGQEAVERARFKQRYADGESRFGEEYEIYGVFHDSTGNTDYIIYSRGVVAMTGNLSHINVESIEDYLVS